MEMKLQVAGHASDCFDNFDQEIFSKNLLIQVLPIFSFLKP